MSPESENRDRLIRAAQELFYAEGIHRSGVEALAARAGVTKPTLYNLFGSKEALLEAALDGMRRARIDELEACVEAAGGPRERLWMMVERHARGMEQANGFRGCPLAVAAQEPPQTDYSRETAREFKAWVRDRMARDAKAAGLRRPKALGWQLMLLIEGGTIGTYLFGGAETARQVRDAARALIAAHEPD